MPASTARGSGPFVPPGCAPERMSGLRRLRNRPSSRRTRSLRTGRASRFSTCSADESRTGGIALSRLNGAAPVNALSSDINAGQKRAAGDCRSAGPIGVHRKRAARIVLMVHKSAGWHHSVFPKTCKFRPHPAGELFEIRLPLSHSCSRRGRSAADALSHRPAAIPGHW